MTKAVLWGESFDARQVVANHVWNDSKLLKIALLVPGP
jgi:hypothetical protein